MVTAAHARPGANRRADIQGLRAVAVLMVVLFHARLPLPGGFTGVDVFFVISGFVITAMLARQWAADGRVSLRTFYLRRYLRLTPALAVLVAFTVLASVVLLSPFGPQQTAAATAVGALLLVANLVIAREAGDYFAVAAEQNPLLHTWSLSVEEQFYLFFPALVVGAWALSRTRGPGQRLPIRILATVTVLSFALSALWTSGSPVGAFLTEPFGGPEVFAFYGPLTRIWEFGAGALLALALEGRRAPGRRLAQGAGLAGAVLLLAATFAIDETMPFPGVVALVPVVGTLLVIVAGSGAGSLASRALAVRPMVWIGDRSYSWYLWHWPLIVFAGVLLPGSATAAVVAGIGSLLPAWLSYRFVEQPLRALRPRRVRTTASVIAVTSLTPIALGLVLIAGAASGWGGRFEQPPAVAVTALGDGQAVPSSQIEPASAEMLAAGDGAEITEGTTKWDLRSQHVAVAAGCVNSAIKPRACRFGPADAAGTVLLLGDSQAYAVADGVIDAAAALGHDTVVSSNTGCPFLGRDSSGGNKYDCRQRQQDALAYALRTKPAAVVIANRSAGYVHPEWDWRTAATDSGQRAGSVSEAADLWRRGLQDVVGPLRKAGIPVVIVAAVPEMPQFTDQRSLFAQAFGAQAYEVDRATVVADRKPALDAERAVARANPGTLVFDPIPALCTDVCASAVDGVMRYQDETHLTVDGSRLLTPGVREALAQALG